MQSSMSDDVSKVVQQLGQQVKQLQAENARLSKEVQSANLEYLTKEEVAQLFRISERTISRLMLSGKIPKPVRLGRAVRWKKSDLERLW